MKEGDREEVWNVEVGTKIQGTCWITNIHPDMAIYPESGRADESKIVLSRSLSVERDRLHKRVITNGGDGIILNVFDILQTSEDDPDPH